MVHLHAKTVCTWLYKIYKSTCQILLVSGYDMLDNFDRLTYNMLKNDLRVTEKVIILLVLTSNIDLWILTSILN